MDRRIVIKNKGVFMKKGDNKREDGMKELLLFSGTSVMSNLRSELLFLRKCGEKCINNQPQ